MNQQERNNLYKMQDHLQEEHRISLGFEYSCCISTICNLPNDTTYELHVLCEEAFVDDVIEHLHEFNIPVRSLHIFGRRGW